MNSYRTCRAKNTLDSKLQVDFISSVRIFNRTRVMTILNLKRLKAKETPSRRSRKRGHDREENNDFLSQLDEVSFSRISRFLDRILIEHIELIFS